jgi:hypothetical protein
VAPLQSSQSGVLEGDVPRMRNGSAASRIAPFHHEDCVVALAFIGFDLVKSVFQDHDRILLLTGILSISGK